MLTPAGVGADVGQTQEVAPGVYFREGDLEKYGHCNTTWVVFDDYVVVIDANFPSGAKGVLAEIRRTTEKPVRFVFDTHHHGDHAYGNAIWVQNGAVIVAQENVLEEIRRYEPARWQAELKNREDVARLGPEGFRLPTVLFSDRMSFDDGKRRLELLYFGAGHTRGDGFAYLPKERILITGDACLNGPYNYLGDSDTSGWIRALEAAEKLDFDIVLPGHGPLARNGKQVLAGQKQFLMELRKQVQAAVEAKKSLQETQRGIQIPSSLNNWLGQGLPAQIEHVYREMTRQTEAGPQQ